MDKIYCSKPLIEGEADGETLVSQIPLSFWGGVNVENGHVVDVRHDLFGKCITGKILFIPGGRGSCSGSGIILEMIRRKTAPAAIVSIEAEPILAIGSIIGKELYGKFVPVFTLEQACYEGITSGVHMSIESSGKIIIYSN